jgi:hypothetical protein
MKFSSIVLALAVAADQFSSTFAATPKSTGVPDTATVSESSSVLIDVVANDLYDVDVCTAGGSVLVSTISIGAIIGPSIDSQTSTGFGAGTAVASVNAYPQILYTPDPGFIGTVSMTYKVTFDGTASDATSVTIQVIPDVPQIFENPLAITNQGAFNVVNPGLREKALGLTFGAPSQLGINGILDTVTDVDSSDIFLSNAANPALQQSNRGQSFTDFYCNMPWSNCNN